MTEKIPTRTESMASTASSTTSSSSTTPTALPTEEALQLLLSPDGYYKYLGIPIPEPDLMGGGPKYQAAMAAGGAGPTEGGGGMINLDQVKKNYRRLSLKHHPDRKTGDAETFRMLNRAKIVLSSPKLRREYDLVGLDLDDDAEDDGHHHEGPPSSTGTAAAENGEGGADGTAGDAQDDGGGGGKDGSDSKTETVMGHLASATLAAVLQVVVRTALMGLVSVLISRYTILAFLAMGMLAFLTTRMYATVKQTLGPNIKPTFAVMREALSPLLIAFGIFCMYRGRRFVIASTAGIGDADNAIVGDGTSDATTTEVIATQYLDWSWTFLIGETIVMTSFISNSFEKRSNVFLGVFTILSLFLSLWLRGKFWRYATILGFEGILALLVLMAFPIMEMILESIVEEKMRKVGEKIRMHDVRMKEMLRRKREGSGSAS
ncbi:hypothetical protein ACHAXR_011694 [Thalassiosira sp. AJA248-18]